MSRRAFLSRGGTAAAALGVLGVSACSNRDSSVLSGAAGSTVDTSTTTTSDSSPAPTETQDAPATATLGEVTIAFT